MILTLFSFFSLSLESSGNLYYGFYPTDDTLYNSDVSIWTRVTPIKIKEKTNFFIQYTTYLEMAEQKGKVILDPAYADYSLIFGFQYSGRFYLSFYINHYCRHPIDREEKNGRVVFNAENFIISNAKNSAYRFQKTVYFRGSYIFYPQGIIVDWLNSKPYYRHRFTMEFGKNINSFSQFALGSEYTLSNDNPRKIYYKIQPGIYIFKRKENQTLYTFIQYYIAAKGPFRSPSNLFFIGIGYSF